MKPSLSRRRFLQDSGLNVALMVISSRQSQPPRPAVSPKLEPSEKVFLKTWDLVELPNLAISLSSTFAIFRVPFFGKIDLGMGAEFAQKRLLPGYVH